MSLPLSCLSKHDIQQGSDTFCQPKSPKMLLPSFKISILNANQLQTLFLKSEMVTEKCNIFTVTVHSLSRSALFQFLLEHPKIVVFI